MHGGDAHDRASIGKPEDDEVSALDGYTMPLVGQLAH